MKFITIAIFLTLSTISCNKSSNNINHSDIKIITEAMISLVNLTKNAEYPLLDARDTLMDINCDEFKDILITYHSPSGTGETNCIIALLYDKEKGKFVKNEQISQLTNPTFDCNTKKVTSYYLGNGAGYTLLLKWNGIKLDTIEYSYIENYTTDTSFYFNQLFVNYLTSDTILVKSTKWSLPDGKRYVPLIVNPKSSLLNK